MQAKYSDTQNDCKTANILTHKIMSSLKQMPDILTKKINNKYTDMLTQMRIKREMGGVIVDKYIDNIIFVTLKR